MTAPRPTGHEKPVFTAKSLTDRADLERVHDKTVRVTWIGRSKQELIDTARARLPGELTEEERRRFYLAVE